MVFTLENCSLTHLEKNKSKKFTDQPVLNPPATLFFGREPTATRWAWANRTATADGFS